LIKLETLQVPTIDCFVEVMGRDAGTFLNAGIGAGAEEILIPEENLGLDRLLESYKKVKAGKSSSIVVAERR
jgi:6-phosphofructokinase 1